MRPIPGPTLILIAPCENRAKEPSEPVEPQLNGRIQDHQHAAGKDHARPEAGHVGRTAHEGAVGQPRDNRHGDEQTDVGKQQAQAESTPLDVVSHFASSTTHGRLGRGDAAECTQQTNLTQHQRGT